MTRARWVEGGDATAVASWAPAAIRYANEDLHDISTSVATEIPETSTRVFVFYKINTGYARSDTSLTRPGLDARFDVQINQALPFELGGTRWEVLSAFATFSATRTIPARSTTNSSSFVRQSASSAASSFASDSHSAGSSGAASGSIRKRLPGGSSLTRLFLPIFLSAGFLDRVSGLLETRLRIWPRSYCQAMIYRSSIDVKQGTSFALQQTDSSVSTIELRSPVNKPALLRLVAQLAVVIGLVVLAAMNISLRGWNEVEDGVLWVANGSDVTASVVADDTPASRAGIKPGDVLLKIDSKPVVHLRDVKDVLHASRAGQSLQYVISRVADSQVLVIPVAGIPSGTQWLYLALASVGLFTLFVGTGVRLRRPENQATLHFFWLCVAFFGALAFSFTGRLDFLDWVFYWGDVVATLLLPPLFVHFALVFPERPDSWARSDRGRPLLPLIYLPALLLGSLNVATIMRGGSRGEVLTRVLTLVDAAQFLYLSLCLIAGFIIMTRALYRVRSVTARRQLRWIVWGTGLGALPFVFGYAIPYALGYDPNAAFELTAVLLGLVPLAFASAIIRYRLMDVEVIIKRGLVYAAAMAAIAAIYTIVLGIAGNWFTTGPNDTNPVIAFLATMVLVLLARPVKNAIQTGLDRVYYRDRYDYRRALVGFARDLNSDLDLFRLSERLVRRVTETLLVDRMALMLAPVAAGRDAQFVTVAHSGFGAEPPVLAAASEVATRLIAGHTLTLDDPLSQRRVDPARCRVLAQRRDPLLRPVRLERRDDCGDGARTQVERGTAEQRRHGASRGGCGAGGDGARKWPPLPPVDRQGG